MNTILRIYTANTIKSVALSLIGIYIPIYLLDIGLTLQEVIIFFAISHGIGLLIGLLLFVPLLQKKSPITVLKISFPLQILYLTALLFLNDSQIPTALIAVIYGASSMAYWIPMNLLFLKHSQSSDMGNNMGKFFALPKFFGIFGPLLSAVLIPFVGFAPVFILAIIGLGISYIPLLKIDDSTVRVSLNFTSAWKRLRNQKTLFLFEIFDNIIEESEWFWGIYVYLLVDSLTAPGIIGSLESIGSALFTVFVGKYANKNSKKIIPLAAILIVIIMVARIFITTPNAAYSITILASFVMTLFIVSYFTSMFKTIKGDGEEEFVILREIPTVLGRMVVFGTILLTASNPNLFFAAPIIFTILLLILYFWKRKLIAD